MQRDSILHSRRAQRGATLVVAMIILVLIMMIGLVAVTSSTTQFKLAGNLQFEDSAMNNAETSVAAAERWLAAGTNYQSAGFTTYDSVNTPYLHPIGHIAGLSSPNNDVTTMTWDGTYDVQVTAGDSSKRYLIEQLSVGNRLLGSSSAIGRQASAACNKVNTYMITARGTSSRGAVKLLQSYFSVLAC